MGSRAAGFTLLEMLVVLAITSMISVLLIDGVSQVLTIEQRMGVRTREFREAQLRQHWFRQIIAGAQASRDVPFEMTDRGFRGLTLTPLVADQGVPTPFELTLHNTGVATELRYRESEGEIYTLMSFDNADTTAPPQFLVLLENGTYGTSWRSKVDRLQWPEGLALRVPGLDGELIWHAAILGVRQPPPDIEDMLGI